MGTMLKIFKLPVQVGTGKFSLGFFFLIQGAIFLLNHPVILPCLSCPFPPTLFPNHLSLVYYIWKKFLPIPWDGTCRLHACLAKSHSMHSPYLKNSMHTHALYHYLHTRNEFIHLSICLFIMVLIAEHSHL